MITLRGWSVPLVVMVGCSSGALAPPSATSGADTPLATIRSHEELRLATGVLRTTERGIVREGGELPAMDVVVPTLSTGRVSLSVRGASLAIVAEGVRPVHAAIEGANVVFRDALPDTDIVWSVGRDRAEELRVLRTTKASTTLRFRVEKGRHVAQVRVRGALVEAIDDRGDVVVSTEPLFALDAHGLRRELSLTLDGDRVAATLDPSGLAYPIVVDPVWTATATMAVRREYGVATLLADGKVLVTGGFSPGVGATRSAEVYDPGTNTWKTVGSMAHVRYQHNAIRLDDGRVLVSGGAGSSAITELYDPALETFSASGSLAETRWVHGLAKLADGKVLAIAGFADAAGCRGSIESWNPADGQWSSAGTVTARYAPAIVKLPNADLLAIGGYCGGYYSSVERYDARAKTWAAVAPLKDARSSPGAILLPSGKVFVAGGGDTGNTTSELYDPALNSWTYGPTVPAYRNGAAHVALASGHLLLVGGADTSGTYLTTADVFDPTTNGWIGGGTLATGRAYMASTALGGNRALIAGGSLPGNTLSSAEVFALNIANGASCATALDCASGNCVDGVCCNEACTASCKACDLATSKGTCSDVSGAPQGTRSCAPYLACTAGVCRAACATSADCVSTHYCAGTCQPKKANGGACAAGGECTSGSCADSVCCNEPCAGQCASCNESGQPGTCLAVTGVPRNGRTTCTGTGLGTTCGIACNGVDKTQCKYPVSGAPCSANGCVAGKETHASTCNGAGLCQDVEKTCGAYVCDATACKSTCTSKGDCASGFFCKASVCIPALALGESCTESASCGSGSCVDGVCCSTASCPSGSSCALAGNAGTCSKNLGGTCSAGSECASGFCVDGVCCNAACEGQCEACDVAVPKGTCAPVSGEPHGARAKCDSGVDACKAKKCDGTVTTSCAAFTNGPATTCAPRKCVDGKEVPPGACDGAGGCRTPEPRTCGLYACSAETGCLDPCRNDADCVGGAACTGGACLPKAAGSTKCSDDGGASIAADGARTDCNAYRCVASDGRCAPFCKDSSECATGFVCDGPSRACITAPPAADDGGCATRSPGSGSGHALLGALAIVLAALRRRAADST